MYNKSISSRNDDKIKISKIKTEEKVPGQSKKLLIQKVYSKDNFSSNPSKLADKGKLKLDLQTKVGFSSKVNTPKTISSASNNLSSGSSGAKLFEKKNNLNDETLKKYMSFNYNSATNENANKNLANKNSATENKFKVHQSTNKNLEKKVKSFNFENKDSKIMKTISSMNQFLTITTENAINYSFPNLEKVKISHKNFGIVEAYAATTTEGIVRNYNEDRVSIILNIPKPPNYTKDDWPKCSFFGIYDGHGGSQCADFLRDNLHKNILNDSNFPSNPQKAILNGFIKSEKKFVEEAMQKEGVCEKSGSCAIVLMIIENRCYVANVGDSRAIMSGDCGKKIYCLSRDHKPNDEKEYKRIIEAGGKIYQTEASIKVQNDGKTENIVGPLRVMPGKLSVSRAIGDIEAKNPSFGGNPNVVIAIPEIKYFDINNNYDFIIVGSDGLFEKLKNKEIVEYIWHSFNSTRTKTLHDMSGVLVDNLIEKCFQTKSSDNLTAVLICLGNMKQQFKELNHKNDPLDLEDELPLTYLNNYNSFNKNDNPPSSSRPLKLLSSGNSSRTERSVTEKKLLLNKIIKNTLSMKTKPEVKSENYISLNGK